jgi:UDP-N-acetylmuramoyl-tripeptide--D-alanyl-D-alanine ligase
VNDWTGAQLAQAAGARLLAGADRAGGPSGVVIDSRAVGGGELFVGLPGANVDGGAFAAAALASGAWGVLARPGHLEGLVAGPPGVLLAAEDPLAALGALARAWRRALGARVVAITGSTGKTSTKDMLAALLAPSLATVASTDNRNTEIGVPLTILGAPAGTRALVLELAMRGAGQIAALAEICEPDVGVIVNVGPAHLGLLGSLEAIAAAKA